MVVGITLALHSNPNPNSNSNSNKNNNNSPNPTLMVYQTDNQFRLLGTEVQFPTPSRLHAWSEGDGKCRLGCDCGLGCGKKGSLLHIWCNCNVTMEEEKE